MKKQKSKIKFVGWIIGTEKVNILVFAVLRCTKILIIPSFSTTGSPQLSKFCWAKEIFIVFIIRCIFRICCTFLFFPQSFRSSLFLWIIPRLGNLIVEPKKPALKFAQKPDNSLNQWSLNPIDTLEIIYSHNQIFNSWLNCSKKFSLGIFTRKLIEISVNVCIHWNRLGNVKDSLQCCDISCQQERKIERQRESEIEGNKMERGTGETKRLSPSTRKNRKIDISSTLFHSPKTSSYAFSLAIKRAERRASMLPKVFRWVLYYWCFLEETCF